MSIKTSLPAKSKFNNKRNIVFLPEENDIPTQLIVEENGSFTFKIPFLVDMRKAFESKVKIFIEITNDEIDTQNIILYHGWGMNNHEVLDNILVHNPNL